MAFRVRHWSSMAGSTTSMPVFLPMPLATPRRVARSNRYSPSIAGKDRCCGRSRAGRKGWLIFASSSPSRSRGRKWYFPAARHAIRADEFQQGLEVAEDGSGTAGVDLLLLKYLSVASWT